MYHDGVFFQVIEGETAVVERCYARILCDHHHHHHQVLCLILNDTIDNLTFSGCAMEYAGPHEVRGHTNSCLESLADLRNGRAVTTDADSHGFALALNVFERS